MWILSVSVGMRTPEERSRDHICRAIIRQEGLQSVSGLVALTAHEKHRTSESIRNRPGEARGGSF